MNPNLPILPFIGIPTFLRAPYLPNQDSYDADIVCIGIPFDSGASSRPGARYGPKALREASMIYSYVNNDNQFEGFYDVESDTTILANVSMVDAGDIQIFPANRIKSFDSMHKRLKNITKQKNFLVVFGGDHSISYAPIKNIDEAITVVHFDSHFDFMDFDAEDFCAHACVMRKVSDLENVKSIIHVGIRGLINSKQELYESKKRGNKIITAEAIHKEGGKILSSLFSDKEKYYISFDIDVLDPSIAPGTGTPEPGGFTYNQTKEMLKFIAGYDVVGLDIVEVNPMYDHTTNTSQHAVRLLIDFLGANL